MYASPCAPLLVLWPGEVEGTSLAMAQGKASPVPAPEPMFRVSPVLRRYDADVPPTAVGACCRRRLGPHFGFYAVFCGRRTQHNPLSASAAKNRIENRNWGPKRRLRMAHLVIQTICNTDVQGWDISVVRHPKIRVYKNHS